MSVLFLPALTIAICLLVSFRHHLWRATGEEEFTRAAGLGRQILLTGMPETKRRTRREPYSTASVLGCEETRTTCQIIYGSSSEMRISVTRALPPDAQINVEWDNQFFVGAIREARLRGPEQILSLRVVSTNRR